MASQIDLGLKRVLGVPGLARFVGAARGGAAPAWARAPSGRSCIQQDSPPVLAARWGPPTRSAPCGRCAQTIRASQMTKHAARAHLAAPLLGAHKAPEPMPASPLVPRFLRADGRARTPLKSGHPPARLRLLGLGRPKQWHPNSHLGRGQCRTGVYWLPAVGLELFAPTSILNAV